MSANRILLASIVLVAVLLGWQYQNRLFEDRGRLQVIPVEDGSAGVVLAWHREVDLPMAQRLREAFAQWRNKTGLIIIDLHSPGGALYEGRQVVEAIADMKRTHRVITRVTGENACLSMCVPIFLQGDERHGSPVSVWMFHEPVSIDFYTGEEVDEPEFEKRRTAKKFFERYFVNSEMDPGWRARLEKQWQGKEVWRSGQQLVDERSNIITRLIRARPDTLAQR